jgi:hypothetical protein
MPARCSASTETSELKTTLCASIWAVAPAEPMNKASPAGGETKNKAACPTVLLPVQSDTLLAMCHSTSTAPAITAFRLPCPPAQPPPLHAAFVTDWLGALVREHLEARSIKLTSSGGALGLDATGKGRGGGERRRGGDARGHKKSAQHGSDELPLRLWTAFHC